jgi:hypothetical protein
MSDRAGATPKHIWIVGGLSLLWNSLGAFDYVMTRTRNAEYLAQFTPEQVAYFDAFPVGMGIVWALGVWGSVAGSLLLLARNRHAVGLFGLSLVGIVLSAIWQFGLSGADIQRIFGVVPIAMTTAVFLICLMLFLYTRRQRAAGVLS